MPNQLYALLVTAESDYGPFGAQFLGLYDLPQAAYDQVVGPEYSRRRQGWLNALADPERTRLWGEGAAEKWAAEWAAPALEPTVDDKGRISWGNFGYWLEPVQINVPYTWDSE